MTHLSLETLTAWRDQPTDALRAEVVGHLGICNHCAARYAELIRSAPVASANASQALEAFAARGREVRGASGTATRASRWAWGVLAAAAVVVIAVVSRPQPAADAPVTRGTAAFDVVAPVGAVRDVSVFTWRAPAGSTSFRLEITDAAGALIHEARVAGQQWTAPPDVVQRLTPGVEYTWMVSRLDVRGDIVDTTRAVTFVVSR